MKKTFLSLLLISLTFLLISCTTMITISFYEEQDGLPKTVEIKKGTQVNEPNIPTKEGMEFVGWYTNLNNPAPFNFNAYLDEDLSLYAKWESAFDMNIDRTKTFSAAALWAHRDKQKTTNLILDDNNIMIEDASKTANYESDPISITKFKELVLSWNIRDLDTAKIIFKVAVGKNDNFSNHFTMGIWEKDKQQIGTNVSDPVLSVSHDILSNKDLTNDMIKLIFNVIPNNDDSFKINNISVTTKQDDSPLFVNENNLENIELDVPAINQLSVPVIGNSICSPTSVTMVLNYYGYDYKPETIAAKVKGTQYNLYGNWTFNVAVAGEHNDLYGRVEYIDNYSVVMEYLKQGIPVVLSIRTQTASDLPGSIMGYPAGHLIVLIGFEYIDNTWYAIINDPAFYYDSDVRVLYPVEKVLLAHRGYSYIISNTPLD